jgi:hypothetical protein
VPATQLINVLPRRVKELLADFPEDQNVDVSGRVLELVAQRLASPPDVEIEVALSPADLDPQPLAELLFQTVQPQQVAPGWPLKFTGPPGIYKVTATGDGRSGETVFNADPPMHRSQIEVSS